MTSWGEALVLACARNDKKAALDLIERGAAVNEYGTKAKKYSALHLSVYHRNYDVTMALLLHGADPLQLDADDNTPLHWAVDKDDQDHVVLLLDHIVHKMKFTDLSAVINSKRQSPLHFTKMHHDAKILHFLLKSGFNINQRDGDGNTLLHLAVIHNNPLMIKIALGLGANHSLKNRIGKTAMQLALEKNDKKYVCAFLTNATLEAVDLTAALTEARRLEDSDFFETLMSYGAKPELDILFHFDNTDQSLTMLDALFEHLSLEQLSRLNMVNASGDSIVHHYINLDGLRIIAKFIAKKIPINLISNHDVNTIVFAIAKNKWDFVLPLAKAWHDIASVSDSFRNMIQRALGEALLIAARENKTSVVIELVDLKPSLAIFDEENHRFTALHFAIQWKNYRMVDALLRAGADSRLRNSERQKPIEYAVSINADLMILKKLREYDFINNPQNTHIQSLEQSAISSIERLRARYAARMIDTIEILNDIRAYIADLPTYKREVIEGVIDPIRDHNDFSTQSPGYNASPQEVLVFVWLGLQDRNIHPGLTDRDISDHKVSLMTQLESIHIGPHYYCAKGAMNRILQTLEAAHPDIQLKYELNPYASYIEGMPDRVVQALKVRSYEDQNAILKNYDPEVEPVRGFIQQLLDNAIAHFTDNGSLTIARCEIDEIRACIVDANFDNFHPLFHQYNQTGYDRFNVKLPYAWLASLIHQELEMFFSNDSTIDEHYIRYERHIELYKVVKILVKKSQKIAILEGYREVIEAALAEEGNTKLDQIILIFKMIVNIMNNILVSGLHAAVFVHFAPVDIAYSLLKLQRNSKHLVYAEREVAMQLLLVQCDRFISDNIVNTIIIEIIRSKLAKFLALDEKAMALSHTNIAAAQALYQDEMHHLELP